MKSDCGICWTDEHDIFKCPSCSHSICTQCILTMISVDHLTEIPDCTNCGRESIMYEFRCVLGSEFMNQLHTDIGGNVMDRELTYMNRTKREMRMEKLEKSIVELYQRFIEIDSSRMYDLAKDLMNLLERYSVLDHNNLLNCPREPHCAGLIESDTDRCDICDLSVCSDCGIIKESIHECREEDLSSMRIILENTRSCPRCHIRIERESGCDVMWCTQCHISFDWNDGSILRGDLLHNPHLIDHLESIDDDNYGCFILGNLSVRDIPKYPQVMSTTIKRTIMLDSFIHRIESNQYHSRFFDKYRRSVLNLGPDMLIGSLREATIEAIFKTYSIRREIEQAVLPLIKTFTRLMKDILINFTSDNMHEFVTSQTEIYNIVCDEFNEISRIYQLHDLFGSRGLLRTLDIFFNHQISTHLIF